MGTSRTRANNKYNQKTYDQLKINVRKGTRDQWKTEATRRGLSLAALIVKAVEEYLTAHPPDDNSPSP